MHACIHTYIHTYIQVHAKGVIHNDIKLSNILYDRARGACLLVDFGLASQCQPVRRKKVEPPAPAAAQARHPAGSESLSRLKGRSLHVHKPPHAPHAHKSGRPGVRGAGAGAAAAGAKVHAALRNGTKGFRAPEVVLGSLMQTCAVDLWSAGVVMLCCLSRSLSFPWLTHDSDAKAVSHISSWVPVCGVGEWSQWSDGLRV